jgi:hypothetical protein
MKDQNPQATANLYALTPEQVEFVNTLMDKYPLQGTAGQLRPILATMDGISAALDSPAECNDKTP